MKTFFDYQKHIIWTIIWIKNSILVVSEVFLTLCELRNKNIEKNNFYILGLIKKTFIASLHQLQKLITFDSVKIFS